MQLCEAHPGRIGQMGQVSGRICPIIGWERIDSHPTVKPLNELPLQPGETTQGAVKRGQWVALVGCDKDEYAPWLQHPADLSPVVLRLDEVLQDPACEYQVNYSIAKWQMPAKAGNSG